MDVNPSDASTVDLPSSYELGHFRMNDRSGLSQLSIGGENSRAASAVSDQELAIYEIVAEDCLEGQQPIQFSRIRFCSNEKSDPDRGVNEHHYAPRPFRVRFSRRRGTSRAWGSEPRRARMRS